MQRILIQPFRQGLRLAMLTDENLTHLTFERHIQPNDATLDDIVVGRVLAVRHDFIWFDLGLSIEGVVKTPLLTQKKPTEGALFWLQVNRLPWPEIGGFSSHEKGYRLTPHITLAGRYWLHTTHPSKWTPRTIALGYRDDDPKVAFEKEKLHQQAIPLHTPPSKIGIVERGLTQWQRWIRDSCDNVRIICETPAVHHRVFSWVSRHYPDKCDAITPALQTEIPLFETYGVDDHWAEILSPQVSLPGGGSLDIRELPAATLIDVNAGTEQANAFQMNLKALSVIKQHIMWRTITGNILIDFIRLSKVEQHAFTKQVTTAFKNTDVRVLGFCDLGLLQLQRSRHRPSLLMELMAKCPQCHGDGFIDNI